MPRTSFLGSAAVLALCCALFPPSVSAQAIYFGKNKVQYSDFGWRVLESAHFHLYFYDAEEALAQSALVWAEESYDILRVRFVHEVREPIPLIVYSSHQDFEQTNVTPYFLPEGVAGLTEHARGRVVMPFGGSIVEFRETLQHELVHVFQRSLAQDVHRRHFRATQIYLPLWFTEGLAVHWSEERDPEADMVLRDLVVGGALPELSEFWRYDGTFTLYKLGQSMLDHIGETYGEDRIRLFYDRIWRWRTFEEGIEDVLGVTADQLSAEWTFALQQRYFPGVTAASPAEFASTPLTRAGGYAMKPLPLVDDSSSVDAFAFLSNRGGFTNLYRASRTGEERQVEVLLPGERKSGFESFHAFRTRLDVGPGGELFLVAQHRDQDEIVVFSLPEREVTERYRFEDLVGLRSPSVSADGRRVVFSGLGRDGTSDLYLLDRTSGALRRLTEDRYEDLDPSYCPWADVVVWSSDRTPGGDRGARNLFRLDLESGEIRHLTRGAWNDQAPSWETRRQGLLFVSDRDSFHDVYWVDERGNGERLTRSLDAIFDPRAIDGERAFLATIFHRGSFQVRRFAWPDSALGAIALAPPDSTPGWRSSRSEEGEIAAHETKFRSRFALDIAQGGVVVDPAFRTGEGVQAVISDVMGDHLVYLHLANSTVVDSDFLDHLSFGVNYVNLSRRLNYGVSAFHFSGDRYDATRLPYFERTVGAGVFLSYPLNRFERVETNVSVAHTDTDRPSNSFRRRGVVGTHTLSFVRDTSLWLSTGPIDGQRLHLTAGLEVNVEEGAPEATLLLGDYRRYFRLGLRSAYALRVQGRWSDGDNPEIYTLGGSHSLRVHPLRTLLGNRTLLVNHEVRFPLVRGFLLGLPMGSIELPGIEGAVFADAATAWSRGPADDWLGAYGVGLRMGFGGVLVLRMDFGRRTDFTHWGRRTHSDFFVGWNY